MNTGETAMGRPAYKRKVKNYLLDVGLQLRYTATIVVIAVVLTAILVLSISGVGILLTHKVAGPLYKISSFFGRIRDNKLGPAPAKLRKGDELQDFYLSFREMHQAVRGRVEDDVRVLEGALTSIEATAEGRAPSIQKALDELRQLRKRKEDSLEAPPIDRMTTSSNV